MKAHSQVLYMRQWLAIGLLVDHRLTMSPVFMLYICALAVLVSNLHVVCALIALRTCQKCVSYKGHNFQTSSVCCVVVMGELDRQHSYLTGSVGARLGHGGYVRWPRHAASRR